MLHTYNQTWRGTDQSFQYDITLFERIPKLDERFGCFKENWAYYIYLAEDNLPEDIRAEFLNIKTDEKYGYFQYSDLPLIHNIDFHGGVTFFDIIYTRLNKKVWKIGCDYQHFWDEGQHYSKEYLEHDAINSINRLEEICPNLKYRCSWDGKYYPKEQGIVIKNGEFTIQKEKYEACPTKEK